MSTLLKTGSFRKRSPIDFVKMLNKPDAKTGIEQNITYDPVFIVPEPSDAEKEIYDLEWQIAEAQHELASRNERSELPAKIEHLKLTLQDLKDELKDV